MQNSKAQFKIQKHIMRVCLIFVFCFLNFVPQDILAYGTTSITIEILALCGNNIKESGEQCDDGGSNGACPAACSLACSANSCSSGGNSGGGGGTNYISQTAVIFSGKAYPLSKVNILMDGQIAITTIAGPDANFNISLTGLSSGNYIFSVYGEDNHGRRSSLFTFPIFITEGASTSVSGIFIAPTIAVDKSEVKRGDNIAIFGQSTPKAEITIAINSDEEFFDKTFADGVGVYLYNFDTSELDAGQHFTKSKAALDGAISSFSKSASFNVGTKIISAKPKETTLKGDTNGDKRVNLVDFSIAVYWYKRPSPPTSVDLNSDGKVNLVDFSIMAFYWTG